MKPLYPSFADPKKWRDGSEEYKRNDAWRRTREGVLRRDDYSCQYCEFHAMHWQNVVDLYRKSLFSQSRIIQITRQMRNDGKGDASIIAVLGVEERTPFRMDRRYLHSLFGFVTSRRSEQDWTQKALEYGYRKIKHEIFLFPKYGKKTGEGRPL